MDTSSTLRQARRRAGLTQAALARRAGTSQAAISAYESGSKRPSVDTLSRLLAATGHRLTAERDARRAPKLSQAEVERADRILVDVLELAESLPQRPPGELRYPPLIASISRTQ